MYQPSMKDRLAELEGEKRELDAFLAQGPEPLAVASVGQPRPCASTIQDGPTFLRRRPL
ncbi:hypothetical protein SAMN05444149_10722 [Pseudosulfitobacter pseudonitzschiae]|nr:hypothetical protein SAMN05444149_10722 [Pseudosulfitobacter pseudonitzschiae]